MTSDPVLSQLADLASTVAMEAGTLVTDIRSESLGALNTKSSPTDLVTAADSQAEELITRRLLDMRPDDSILGEEGVTHHGTSGVTWHIDPIDGTTNYVYGIPAYCVSIGAEVDGQLAAGAVYDPSMKELFVGVKGQGAQLNGKELSASTKVDLSTALIATGFSYHTENRRQQAQRMVGVLPAVRDIRRSGSAALDLCSVACGRIDAYFEQDLNMWDLAAGALIAAEAGARVENLNGSGLDGSFTIAATVGIFDALHELLMTS